MKQYKNKQVTRAGSTLTGFDSDCFDKKQLEFFRLYFSFDFLISCGYEWGTLYEAV